MTWPHGDTDNKSHFLYINKIMIIIIFSGTLEIMQEGSYSL